MILGFSTKINGKETFFVEKIIRGLHFQNIISTNEAQELFKTQIIQYESNDKKLEYFKIKFDRTTFYNSKLHTIREDKKKRWKAGVNIDFFINTRQKNMFRFAPTLPVVSTQKIEIKYVGFSDGFRPWVKIDGKNIYTLDQIDSEKMLQLSQNDGFDTVEEFFEYFNEDFTGKIIHWTNLRY